MKRKYREVLHNTVYIFLRDNAKRTIWHYYFSFDGYLHRGSTGKFDIHDATIEAIDRYMNVKNGVVPAGSKRTSFKDIARRWLKVNETHTDIDNKRKAVEKFFIPFFDGVARIQDISRIRQSDLNDYLIWRRDYYVTGPGSVTPKKQYDRDGKRMLAKAQEYGVPKNVSVNRENQNLNLILALARKESLIDSGNPVKMDMLPDDGGVRPFFTNDQCDILLALSKQRIAEGHSDKIKAERQMAYDYIVTVSYTGLRPHEAHGLVWQDIDLNTRLMRVRKGKTGHRMVAMTDQPLLDHLADMLSRRIKAAGDKFNDSQLIFSDLDGNPVKSFKTAFEGLVKACGFKSPDGQNYSFYSLRHHRATAMIEDDVPDGMVVKNLGTSRKMLDRFYDRTNAQTLLKWSDQKKTAEAGRAGSASLKANDKADSGAGGLELQENTGGLRLGVGESGVVVVD